MKVSKEALLDGIYAWTARAISAVTGRAAIAERYLVKDPNPKLVIYPKEARGLSAQETFTRFHKIYVVPENRVYTRRRIIFTS
jgi:hypothetical protein